MKNLKFPEINKNELEKLWKNLKIGDKIVSIEYNMWRASYYINYFEVTKITPKGNIRLSNNELIKIECFDSYNYYIITDEVKEWINKMMLEEKVLRLINSIRSNQKEFIKNTTYEEYLKLEEFLKDKF